MQIQITLNLGNAAMLTPDDVAAAVTDSFLRAGRDPFTPLVEGESARIIDANGNRVGDWKVTA